MLIDDLSTPCVLVEEGRLARNLRRAQDKAAAEGVALRPHVKTHKSFEIARRQVELGARGITVATVGEAEAFVDAGFTDVCIAYPAVGRRRLERIASLCRRARITFCVDTRAGADAAAEVFEQAGVRGNVLIEIDTGHRRTGVPWNDIMLADLAAAVNHHAGLLLTGLLTHGGQSYHGPSEGESTLAALERHATEERDRILDAAERLDAAGLILPAGRNEFTISVGSTPSFSAFENTERGKWRVTEARPGNYVFHDAMQVALGAATLADCALSVLGTVVSKRRDGHGGERVFVDAGKKVLTSDSGYGTNGYGVLLYNSETMEPLPHARITGLSEEHGWIEVRGGSTLSIGDVVRIVPNHACVVVATQNRLFMVDGDEVLGELPVDARGAW